jgi:hypothetical protein
VSGRTAIPSRSTMTPNEFRICLEQLAWSQRGLARLLNRDYPIGLLLMAGVWLPPAGPIPLDVSDRQPST